MLKRILFILFLSIAPQLEASSFNSFNKTSLCVWKYAFVYKEAVKKLPTDKAKHCAVSCRLARKCDAASTMGIGVLKELWDLLGNGNPELADLRANMRGIWLARSVHSMRGCDLNCAGIYPKRPGR